MNKIYLVLAIRNETIGTTKEKTKEYEYYLQKERESQEYFEENPGSFGYGVSVPSEPKEKYHDVALKIPIPRIIEISIENPYEKYKDRLLNDSNIYSSKVWIESVEINDNNEVIHDALVVDETDYKSPFITDKKLIDKRNLKESIDSANL